MGILQFQLFLESVEKEFEQDGFVVFIDGSIVESLLWLFSLIKFMFIVYLLLCYQSDVDLEVFCRKLVNVFWFLKKCSFIIEFEGFGGFNIQKLLYQCFNILVGGMEGIFFYQFSFFQDFMGILVDVDNGNINVNGNLEEFFFVQFIVLFFVEFVLLLDVNDNELFFFELEEFICL